MIWNPFIGRLIKIGGIILVASSLAFVAHVTIENFTQIRNFGRQTDALILGVAFLFVTLLCLGALMLQIWAWLILVRGASDTSVPSQNAVWLFGRTAIAKYVPGNLFHYVGRHVLGVGLGFKQEGILAATLAEVAVVIAASCTISVAALLVANVTVPGWLQTRAAPGVLVFGILVPVCMFLGARLASRLRYLSWLSPLATLPSLTWGGAYLLYIAFGIAGAGAFIVVLAATLGDVVFARLSLLLAAYSASYVVGFITPGAPGGIGVREALLLLSLAHEFDEPAVVLAAILHRLGSIAAEAVLFAATLFFAPTRVRCRGQISLK